LPPHCHAIVASPFIFTPLFAFSPALFAIAAMRCRCHIAAIAAFAADAFAADYFR